MIAVSHLGLTLGKRTILDDVGFAVRDGESVALVGANGSGKTSVLRCLLGLVPFTGEAKIGGLDVVTEAVEARRLVAWLPQRPAFGDATAQEWLQLVAGLRGLHAKRYVSVLERVGLGRHAGERVRTFSGGMQQRLSLATALLADAPVLLLDEPTTSLDREGQQVLDAEMRAFRKGGRTILIATHRADEVARWSDRTLTLDNGRLGAASREWSAGTVIRPVSLVEVAS